LPATWDDYLRFRPLCCVDSLPYQRGQCWTLGLRALSEEYWIDADIGFIGYNYPFRHNSIRNVALPILRQIPKRSRMTWINRHVRTLSRIMIRPAYRGRGYASRLLENTLGMVNADFVECLTFTESIAHILERAGFKNYGKTGGLECDYYLWHSAQVDITIAESSGAKITNSLINQGIVR
jgi:GNAT superfamily N-acetyltransferase